MNWWDSDPVASGATAVVEPPSGNWWASDPVAQSSVDPLHVPTLQETGYQPSAEPPLPPGYQPMGAPLWTPDMAPPPPSVKKKLTPEQEQEDYWGRMVMHTDDPSGRFAQALKYAKEEYDANQKYREEQGWGYRRASNLVRRGIPFVSTMVDVVKFDAVLAAARHLESVDPETDPGGYDNQAIHTIAQFLVEAEEAKKAGYAEEVESLFDAMPAFMGELLMTGGAFTGGKVAAEAAAKRLLKKLGEKAAGKIATKVAGGVAGSVALAAANPQLTAKKTIEEMLPTVEVFTDSQGNSVPIELGPGHSFAAALPRGFYDATLEVGSEYGGTAIMKGVGKLGGVLGGLTRFIPNWAKLKPPQRLIALRKAVAAKWLSGKAGRTLTELQDRLSDAGWDGILGELAEERLADVGRMLPLPGGALQTPYENPTGQLLIAAPYEAITNDNPNAGADLQKQAAYQLGVELGGFGAVGGLTGAAGFAANKLDKWAGAAEEAKKVSPSTRPSFDVGTAEAWAAENPTAAQELADRVASGKPVSRRYLGKKLGVPNAGGSTAAEREEFAKRVAQQTQQVPPPLPTTEQQPQTPANTEVTPPPVATQTPKEVIPSEELQQAQAGPQKAQEPQGQEGSEESVAPPLVATPTTGTQPVATTPTEATAAVPGKKIGPRQYKTVGQNISGEDIQEDERGVRSIVRGNVRSVEPVAIAPTKTGVQTVPRREAEYQTVDERIGDRLQHLRDYHGDQTIQSAPAVSQDERRAEQAAKKHNRRIVWIKSDDPNFATTGAAYAEKLPEVIFMRSGLDTDPMWGVFGHELAHSTKFDRTAFSSELINEMAEKRMRRARNPKYERAMREDADLRYREGVAQFTQDLMSDPAFRERVFRENQTLLEKIREFFRKFVGAIGEENLSPEQLKVLEWLRGEQPTATKKLGEKKTEPAPSAAPKSSKDVSEADIEAQILARMTGQQPKAAESKSKKKGGKKSSPMTRDTILPEQPLATPLDAAKADAKAFWDEFRKRRDDGDLVLAEEPPKRDPALTAMAARMVARFIKAGTHDFADAIRQMSEFASPQDLTDAENYLREAWDIGRELFPGDRISKSEPIAALVKGTSSDTGQESGRRGDSSGKTDSAADLEAESTEVRVGTQQPRVSGSSGGRGQELAGDKESADVTGGATVGGGQQRTTGVGGTTRPRRDGGVPAGNFKLTDDVQVGGKAGFEKKARYRDNIAAIKLLKQLEKDSRHATVDEQKVLAKYVGWGGLKEVFKKKVGDNWRAEAAELKELLTAEEYAAARRSMQNAHFTAPSIVKAIWSGIERLGFRGGRITEPSMGSGLFFSLAPDTVRDHPDTRLVGVELDSITGRIAQRLFPNADIRVAGYQELDVPDNSVDLHVSNVPFGAVTIYDRHDKELKRGASIHNFFFEKAIKKTRPGGLVVFLTSRYSLDEHSSADRKRWRELGGDLVGAIRLPGDTFKGIADTSVVTDILIFQKRRAEGKPGGQDFISRGELKQIGYLGFTEEGRTPTRMEGETTFPVNEYFVNNPEHVVGELAWTGTMREKGGLNVERAGVNVAKKIEKAFDEIAERVNADALADGSLLVAPSVVGEASAADWPEDWLRVEGERIFIRQNGKKIEVPAPYLKHEKDKAGDVTTVATSKTAADRYQGLIDVFEAAEKLVALQPNPVASDADVEAARTELNRHYDAFVKKYGPMSAGWNNTFASRSITMLSRLRSIENYDPTENTASKTAIFTRRTERPHVQPIRADGAEQALRLSLAYRGKIDFPYMERLSGLDENRLINELGPAIYSNPETKHWETAEEYLSGNVRQKITAAEAAAKKDNQYSRNVEALTERIPEDKPISKIGANMGSTWIPLADYEAFYEQTFHKNFKFRRALSDNTWVLEGNTRQVTERENVDYGTEERPAFELMERYLNNRDITVRRSSNGVSYVDQEATANAKAKLEALKNKFIEWLWGDTERADRLHRLYNDNYNSDREADWDGSHLTFPGMSDEWRSQLNPHQVNAIWRYIQAGNMLLAHIVGAGKTATMAAMAMEAKRLSGNPHYKTIITVPNHLITSGQFQKEVLEVYPSAKLLAATPDMLSAKGRRTFLKRIASENYDIVVVAHSSFSKIPLDPNYEREFIQQQVADLEQEIRRARADSDRSYEQELEAQKQRLEEKLQKLSNQVSRDANSVYFDQLGVDALFVDEAHLYKNLQVRTRMSRVPGVSTAYSARAFDMWMKTRYFNEKSNYRGLVLATGTPIANSLGELYVMQLYMQPQLLESLGIGSFDAWVANFGEQVTRPEIDPAGGGMRMHSRLARYKNVRDVMAMFRRVADVKLLKHLKSILNRPPMIGGKPQRVEVARNPWLEQYVERLQGRARAVRSGRVDPTEDNMLKIGTDGRKAAFDIRLVDPSAPDLADSKLNRGVENVHRIWKDTAADRLTQLVWIDVTSPENKQPGQLNLYREFVEKLVAKGVPREEIAVIHDYDEKTKPGLFVDMNKGKVRILLGSTDKMGTGVNVQRLLIANHHLDPPAYRPDKVEQRDGRILRRGNLNTKGVHIFQYIAKGSFDARMWDILESKTSFISQAMNGEGEDSLEEDNGEMTAAEMKAAASDNPHLMEYVEVDAAVRQLELERRAFIDEQHSIRSRIKSAEWNRDYKRKTADEYEVFAKEYAAFLESLGDAEIQAKLDDATFTEKKPFGEALLAKINALKDTIKQTGESRNDTFYFKFNGTNGKIWIAYQKYSDSFLVHATLEKGSLRVGDPSLGDSDSGNVTRLLNALQDSTTKPEALRYETEQQAASIIELNKRLGRQWDKTAELEKKTLRRGELFNLTQRDDTLEQEVMRILTSRLGKKVVISDTAKYVYAEDGSDVPEPVRDAALDVANQHRLERRLRELEQQKSHAVVYEWTPPPTPPPKRKGFKKKTATDIQREADDEGDFVEDPGFLGARRRKIRKATIHPSVQFDNPEVEKQIQQSRGVQPKSIKEKIEASLEKTAHVLTRTREHLPNTEQFAAAHEILRLMDTAPQDTASDATTRIGAILDPLDKEGLDIFERKILADNMLESVRLNQPTRFGIPANEHTIRDLEAFQQKVDKAVALNPAVQKALQNRRAVVDELVDKLIRYKILDESARAGAKTYFHQQVLAYVEDGRVGRGEGPGRHQKGFTKRRITDIPELGEYYNYNTSYVESEMEWVADALLAIRKEELLKQLADTYDRAAEFTQKAKAQNYENVVGGPKVVARIEQIRGELAESNASEDRNDSAERGRRKALIEEMEEINPVYPYEKQIAKMFGWARNLYKKGEAPLGPFSEQEVFGAEDADDLYYDPAEQEPDSQFLQWLRWLTEEDHGQATIAARAAFKAIDERAKFIRETLGHRYATMRSLASADKKLDLWQATPGNFFYRAFTLPERVVEEVLRTLHTMVPISQDDLREVLVKGGPRPQMVLPIELVTQLNSMEKPHPPGAIAAALKSVQQIWKVFQLLKPSNAIAYMLRNLTGDIDPVIATGGTALKYTSRATKELWDYYHNAKFLLSPELREARKLGVISSSMTASEIPDIKKLAAFQRLYDYKTPVHELPLVAFQHVKQFNEYRENVLRYAAFLDHLDQLNAHGDKITNFGASNPTTVRILRRTFGNEVAAAHLARNLLGDYGNLTVAGQFLRDYVFPFHSWTEVNIKRWPMLMLNAYRSSQLKGNNQAAVAALTAVAVVRLATMTAIMAAFNRFLFGDDEDKLGPHERANPHLLFGHRPDGTIRILRNTGALGDFTEWFGLNTLVSLWPQYENGQISATDVLGEMGKGFGNKLAQGLGPQWKATSEILAGQSYFPDAFNPRAQPRGEAVASAFGVRDEYLVAKGLLSRDGSRARPHTLSKYYGVGTVDPKQEALSEIYALRERFLLQKGKDTPNVMRISAFKPLRDAARAGNYEAFQEGRKAYIAKGKTVKNFMDSLQSLDPLHNRLTDADEEEFETKFLSGVQRQRLRIARDYADEAKATLLLWWHKDVQENGTPAEKGELSLWTAKKLQSFNKTLRSRPQPGPNYGRRKLKSVEAKRKAISDREELQRALAQ